MNMLAEPLRMTAEEFERLTDAHGLELIDGRVREKNMGSESGSINALIGHHLWSVVRPGRLGAVLDSEGMYRCFPNRPNRVRKPDVSFILQARLPGGRVPKGITPFRPDIAVEVVSPNDTYDELGEKVADYLAAGVPLIWVVSPATRTVLTYHADGSVRRLGATDPLTADPFIPGFRVLVADLFPYPPDPAGADPEPAAGG
ncbi:MAG TPA: Uma2 family endonuclease [Urbifossiella sp.]|jgi:Uma2 family endonuclease|nr:Uma2 family endonuclease [Urbifossiella sp.]